MIKLFVKFKLIIKVLLDVEKNLNLFIWDIKDGDKDCFVFKDIFFVLKLNIF